MTTYYVDSAATGSGAGTSWANACTTVAAAIAKMAAGDDLNVRNTSAESDGGAQIWAFPGTEASPNRVFSTDNTNAPAQGSDVQAGGSVTTTTTFGLTITGCCYLYGLTFNTGSGSSSGAFLRPNNASDGQQVYENCNFNLVNSVTTNLLGIAFSGGVTDTETRFVNCKVKFGSTGQSIALGSTRFYWANGSVDATGSIPTTLFSATVNGSSPVNGALVVVDGVDLSALGACKTLVPADFNSHSEFIFKNCKLGASVTVAATPTHIGGPIVDLINCDSAATGYRQERYRYQGTLTTETTVVRSGGASDGDETISWKIVSTANAKRQSPFETFEVVRWFAAGAHTATFECITDNVVLTNADLWVEAQYLGNASFPISALATTAPANQLTSGANLTTSSATWTTTGITTPKPQSAQVSFTSNLDGYVRFVFKVAKASTTVRIDPSPSAVT